MSPHGTADILSGQLERTQNPDRKARCAFVMPALSADAGVREAAFERLRDVESRRREPWALETLRYLNHPLRAAHGRRFVRPALDLLREIQQTGDIFFPSRWMESALWGHRSPEAAAAVRDCAFHALGLPRLVSLIRRGNAASRGVAERIGMRLSAEITRYEQAYWVYVVEPASTKAQ